jgi:hypothetical protein
MVGTPLRRVASVGRGDHACRRDVALGQARHHPPSSPPRVQQPATPPTSPLQHLKIMPPPSTTLGDTNSRPKVDIVVISRNTGQVPADADLSLIIITLAGGNRSAISSDEVRAHLCA